MLRRLELAPPSWPTSIIKILRSATLYEDLTSCLEIIVSEIINTPLDLQYEDPMFALAPLLLITPHDGGDKILLEPFIKRCIPSLLDDPRSALGADQSRSLARVVRVALLLLDQVDPERAKRLVTVMVEEVKYQRSRNSEASEDKQSPKKRKLNGPRPSPSGAGLLVESLAHAFDDESSRSRWDAVRSL